MRMKTEAGAVIGGFELLAEIAAGGQGRVWRARTPAGAEVALKLMRPEIADSEVARRRFLREMRAGMAVAHPRLLRILDAGDDGGTLWIASELAEGGSLRRRVAEHGALAPGEAVALVAGILDALAAVHGAGLLHRDVKPSNILLAGGTWKLADLGLVRSTGEDRSSCTAPGQAIGSPGYLAPEQARGDPDLDRRADLYAAGCVLWFCLVGAPPYTAARMHEVVQQHLTAPVPDLAVAIPGAEPGLCRVLRHLLAKEPAGRPRDAAAAIAELGPVLARLAGVPALPAMPAPATDGPTVTSVSPTMAVSAPARQVVRLPGGTRLAAVAGCVLRCGRSAQADAPAEILVGPDSARRISGLHVEVASDAQGVRVRDLGSTHGTRLDGVALRRDAWMALHDGAELELAGVACQVRVATGEGFPAVLILGPSGSALLLPGQAEVTFGAEPCFGPGLRLACDRGGLWWRGSGGWAPVSSEPPA
jgi:hypothetical protein